MPFAAGPIGSVTLDDLDTAVAAGALGLRLPTGIDDARSRVLMRLAEWAGSLDLGPLLVARLASAPTDTLVALAWQMDLLGARGWGAATDDGARRALLADAQLLHRTTGTPGGVRRALVALGYDAAVVDDAVAPLLLDGSWTLNGEYRLDGGQLPYQFSVELGEHASADAFTAADLATVRAAIAARQNGRSALRAVRIALVPSGTVRTTLGATMNAAALAAAAVYFAVGTNGTAPSIGDTVITGEVRKLIIDHDFPVAAQVRFTAAMDAYDAEGLAVREFGLLNSAGALLARAVRSGAIAKAWPIAFDVSWTIHAL